MGAFADIRMCYLESVCICYNLDEKFLKQKHCTKYTTSIKRKMGIITILLFIIIPGTVSYKSSCSLMECLNRQRGMPPLSIVRRFDKPLPVFGAALMLKSPKGQTGCYVNMGEFLEHFRPMFDGLDLIAVFGFRCKSYDRIYFRNLTENSSRPENVMSFLQVEGCKISLSDYNKLANAINVEHVLFRSHVVTQTEMTCDDYNLQNDTVTARDETRDQVPMQNNTIVSTMRNITDNLQTLQTETFAPNFDKNDTSVLILNETATSEVVPNDTAAPRDVYNCDLFKAALDVWVENPPNNNDTSIAFIINCNGTVPLMREAIFSNTRWTELPEEIPSKFPNLQTLELQKNLLTRPPAGFPWNDELLYNTRNLSRTTYMEEQYSKVYNIEIESNLTRRVFRLDNNMITNLTDFEFHGYLHMISVKENGLHSIGPTTFARVKGLQHLSLDENKIKILPSGVFKGMTSLRHLSLKSNQIENLEPEMFQDLVNLVCLNLANNSLRHLKPRLFVNLISLKDVYLEFNLIGQVLSNIFPVSTVSLQQIFLQNNPINEFPEFLFYIRNLKKADLSNGLISFDNITSLLDRVIIPYLMESVIETTTSADIDFKKHPEHMRKIDLSNNKITFFGVGTDILKSKLHMQKLEVILKHFEFVLSNNPIRCDCNIVPFSNVIDVLTQNGSFTGNEYFFTEWKCAWPDELSNRPMLEVTEKETYCVKNVTSCPDACVCYERSVSSVIIVDCRNKKLFELPEDLPPGELELWFQGNNISSLPYRSYLTRVIRLNVSNNLIEEITGRAVASLENIQVLNLDSNMLARLPQEFSKSNAREIYLKGNPFKCDCNSLWLKMWILRNVDIIRDRSFVACSKEDGEGKQLIKVPDEEFTCEEEFDSIKHMVTPAVACSLTIALFLSVLCVLYIYRLEVKVLLYIYFGFHPFDKDEKKGSEMIDVVIVHSPSITDWVIEHVVKFLEQDGCHYVVCEMMRDFVAGFSYQENITSVVRQSKRMMILLSKDMMDDDDLVKVAWNEAQEKIKELRLNYVIFMTHETSRNKVQNKELKRYLKRGRCIDTQDSLFKEKILYSMPGNKQNQNDKERKRSLPELREVIQTLYDVPEIGEDEDGSTLFVAYSDRDIEYVIKYLKPVLETFGHQLYLPDRDFTPGASKEENILKAIDICTHTLFILSGEHLQDEWSLFTFRCAVEKSLRQKCNHLIVIVADDVNFDEMDEEVKYYVKTHVTLKIGDTWYLERLKNSIPNLSLKELDNEMKIDVDETQVVTEIDANVLRLNKQNLERDQIDENVIHVNEKDGDNVDETEVITEIDVNILRLNQQNLQRDEIVKDVVEGKEGINETCLNGVSKKHGNKCACEKCTFRSVPTENNDKEIEMVVIEDYVLNGIKVLETAEQQEIIDYKDA